MSRIKSKLFIYRLLCHLKSLVQLTVDQPTIRSSAAAAVAVLPIEALAAATVRHARSIIQVAAKPSPGRRIKLGQVLVDDNPRWDLARLERSPLWR